MRNLKKVLSLALAMVMLLGMMVVGAGAMETTFKDNASINDANKEAVIVMNALGILKGDENGFRPNDPVTRAEAAKILVFVADGPTIAAGVKGKTATDFADVPASHWASGYINYCAGMEYISGHAGNFEPEGNVTAAEFGKMMLNAMGSEEKYTGNGWNTRVARDATKAELTENVNITDWNKALTREQASQMAFNALKGDLEGKSGYKVTAPPAMTNIVFDTYLEAYLAAGSDETKVTPASSKTSLGALNYGLTPGAQDDGMGHQVKTWKQGDKVIYVDSVPNETATLTLKNETLTAAELKRQLDALKITKVLQDATTGQALTVDSTDSHTIVTIDGATAVALGTTGGSGATGYVQIADLVKDYSVVEIYANGDTITKIVVVNTYIGVVEKVTEAKGDKARTVTLKVPTAASLATAAKTFENEDLEKDDVVLFTVGKNADGDQYVASCKLADAFDGQVTRYNSTKKTLTINGEVCETATYADPAETGLFVTQANLLDSSKVVAKTDFTFYTDSTGKIVAAKAIEEVAGETNYAVVDEIVYVPGSTTGTGLAQSGEGDYIEARLVMADGTTVDATVSAIKVKDVDKTFSTAATAGKNVKITQKTETNTDNGAFTASGTDINALDLNKNVGKNSALTGKIVTYTYNEEKDTYVITYTATATGGTVTYTGTSTVTSAGVKANETPTAATVTVKGNPAYNNGAAKVANNSTVYLIKTLKDGKAVYTPYTGYKNVETVTATGTKGADNSTAGTTATAEVAIVEKDSVATLVYIDATDANVRVGTTVTVTEVVYILSENYTRDASGSTPVYAYETPDGEVSVSTDHTGTINQAGLYTVTKNGDGVITDATLISTDRDGWNYKTVTVKPADGVLTTSASGAYSYDGTETVIMIDKDGEVVEDATVESMEPTFKENGVDGTKYYVWISVAEEGSVAIKTIYIQAADQIATS